MFDKIKNAFNSLVGGTKAEQEAPVDAVEPEAVVEAEAVVEVAADAPAEPMVEATTVELSFQDRARHVVVEGAGWAIKMPGQDEALEVHAKKKDAVASATEMCKALKGELFVHRKDGKIQSRNSYGNDDPKREG